MVLSRIIDIIKPNFFAIVEDEKKCVIQSIKAGYFYPRPVLASGYSRYLRLSVCVSVCVVIMSLSVQ